MGDKTSIVSIIDRGLTFEGVISSPGKLIIKGTAKGTIIGDTVIIAREGVVNANTKVACMTIGGEFEGELWASEELTILETGSCSGRIICRNLAVEVGGIINGRIVSPPPAEALEGKEKAVSGEKT